MKIVHICLACFYVDGMGYQENLLPKYHAQNHEVTIITSDYAFNSTGTTVKKEQKEYRNEYGITVKVLEKHTRFGLYSKFGDFQNLYATLVDCEPDVIFCHGGQFVALMDVIRYCKNHRGVKLFIDQHGDYYNMHVNTAKERFVHHFIYGYWMRKAVRYAQKFWGVTPWRCQFLREVYRLPEDKIGLLIMGGDDDKIRFDRQEAIRAEIRSKNGIDEDDLLIVTGGKIDEAKNIHSLVNAVKELDDQKVKLLVFGQPSDSFKETFSTTIENNDAVRYIGWVPADEAYNLFLASDLCVFPGTHSVLWEQACACGLPGVFRDWEGMHHVDVGGNAVFLHEDSTDEIKRVLTDILYRTDKLDEMKKAARTKGVPAFSYREIAKRAIFEDR